MQAKNALISVYYKDGILEFARFLENSNWNIISTGGTAAFLKQNGLAVTEVAEITRFPECLDGRVKTLHPAIHAGLLAKRDNPEHIDTLKRLNIEEISLICVNLYPFKEKLAEYNAGKISEVDLIEFIDIGGPAMLRSAAKNFAGVIVLTDPADYPRVQEALSSGGISCDERKALAAKVFSLTSAYDGAIASWLSGAARGKTPDLSLSNIELKNTRPLRYGENAHQSAALHYGEGGLLGSMEILGGKELSYNNIRDLDAAWKIVSSFGFPLSGVKPLGSGDCAAHIPDFKTLFPEGADENTVCCAAVKHCTPCGVALGKTAEEAFLKAYSCDKVSIFGGIVAFNFPLGSETAKKLSELFLEIIIAPDFTQPALDILRAKKNLRVIKCTRPANSPVEITGVDGGVLVQERSAKLLSKWDVVTKDFPPPSLIPDILFGLRTVQWVRSNAIVVVKNLAAVGIGGGETNRLWAAELALERADAWARENNSERARVLVSDAFFPFPDVVRLAASAGIEVIAQSGGSNNDELSIKACDEEGISMVFTGLRYFKH